MKIAFSTLGCPNWALEVILDRASAFGYDGVDFRGLEGEMDLYRVPAFTDCAEETAGRLADCGLEISAFSSGARMFSEDAAERARSIEEVAEYARLCRTFSVNVIRVFGGRIGRHGIDAAVKEAARTLKEMARKAAPARIGVETHDDWVDSRLLARVMRRVRAPNVCVIWDLHHPYRHNGESPRQTFGNIGRYTRYVHVKDSRLDPDGRHHYVLPGEGDVPLAEMIALLKEGGFDGYLTLEWEKAWHPDIAAPEVAFPAYAAFLRGLL
jgi:sugar phosphate isomerase/epimerase